MSGLEIERKFLVRNDDYKRQAFGSSRICQGYICSGHGRTVRVRIRDDRGYLTIKGPSDAAGLSRYEFEKEITMDEARQLMKLCEPGAIESSVQKKSPSRSRILSGVRLQVTVVTIMPILSSTLFPLGASKKNQNPDDRCEGDASGIGSQVEPFAASSPSCGVFLKQFNDATHNDG